MLSSLPLWQWLREPAPTAMYDRTIVWLAFGLMLTGLVMVTSASIPVSTRLVDQPFHFAFRQGIYLIVATGIACVVMMIPLSRWQRLSAPMLLVSMLLLFAVLFIGHSVNGAVRWLPLGIINLQPAEVTKLAMALFLSGYLVRRHEEVRGSVIGFLKPLAVLMVIACLLLAQPDLGSVIVMFVITVGMLFIAGAKLWQFLTLIATEATRAGLLIYFEPIDSDGDFFSRPGKTLLALVIS